MNSIYTYSALAVVALVVAACSGSDSKTVEEEEVKSHYVDMTYAAYRDSLTTAESLLERIERFVDEPTEAALITAKGAYKSARVPYQQSEILRWDTAITIQSNLDDDGGPASVDDWEGQVNAWPLDENFIVGLIQGDAEINKALLISQNTVGGEANVTTGVHAIEFMLWGEDNNGTSAGAGMRPASDFNNDGNCADDFCERRAQYLMAAATLLVDDLTAMVAEWSPEARTQAGTLAYNFLNSDQALDYILGSIRAMASDELASARMSSGLMLGDPEEEHDCFSDLSHIAIYYNFQGVRNAFYGRYNNVSGASLADLVKQKDEDTFNRVDAALNSIENLMSQIRDAGERETNTVRFDQIIGQDSTGVERQIAETAVSELVAIDAEFNSVKELLSLTDIGTGGSGDGD